MDRSTGKKTFEKQVVDLLQDVIDSSLPSDKGFVACNRFAAVAGYGVCNYKSLVVTQCSFHSCMG